VVSYNLSFLRSWVREGKLERLPAREASLDVVPPFQAVAFAQLPTEQDDSTISQGREID
jgi:hypothetical protein